MVCGADDNCKITKEVKKKLIALKQYPRESFCDTIDRLIEKNKG